MLRRPLESLKLGNNIIKYMLEKSSVGQGNELVEGKDEPGTPVGEWLGLDMGNNLLENTQ